MLRYIYFFKHTRKLSRNLEIDLIFSINMASLLKSDVYRDSQEVNRYMLTCGMCYYFIDRRAGWRTLRHFDPMIDKIQLYNMYIYCI